MSVLVPVYQAEVPRSHTGWVGEGIVYGSEVQVHQEELLPPGGLEKQCRLSGLASKACLVHTAWCSL